MHELPVTQSILNIVLKHAQMNNVKKIHAINLAIGEMSDLENEWVQRYFDYLSKDTVAQGARLNIERTPVVLKCESCSNNFEVDIKKMEDIVCPQCGEKKFSLLSGREYYIKNMEAE
ncbi:MAG TPA: hydrogenase maturation nickel metallochaperone HypA [Deltaproteobacteria bacterium]|nr:hydrogenase maturation nickel metallochaperone HypA [Deltaproteobacteria bacterium]HPJ94862.1 hydrogenase maturation nickel metallochaperone HypA [Deltaproteobacteria bacterium]HPR51562.1 hydrogenase maturation nickel metallochaperone HypA [Deltaproteobacteria bacterium]